MPATDMASDNSLLASTFVIKVAERCNLNCTYCYMYNKGDTSFTTRPKLMSKEVASAMLRRVTSYAQRHDLTKLFLVIHGGEPLLIGRAWMEWFLEDASRTATSSGISFGLGLQTNGTLLDKHWIELLARYNVRIGVSCDGPQYRHDAQRVDFAGRGSYNQVRRALDLLSAHYGSDWGVLTVVNPELSGKEVLKHFIDIGIPNIDFLWPDHNYEDLPPWAPGALATYYCELFDYWYREIPAPPRIRWFESAMSLLLGGESNIDALGPQPITDIMVESDGTWEPLDTLRTCVNGMTRTGLDVRFRDVEEIWTFPLYQIGLHNQDLLPETCRSCAFGRVCGGGYLPHRYRRANGFANPSVHCVDLLAVLRYIRQALIADLKHLTSLPA